jgi:hypothetical protein
MEKTVIKRFPPAITHPESFYGFIAVSIAWRFVFLLIAQLKPQIPEQP